MTGWRAFSFSVILAIVFPIIPLILELIFTGKISPETWAITLAIFSISVGAGSKEKVVLLALIVVSIFGSATYGFLLGGSTVTSAGVGWLIVGVVLSVAAHAVEKYNDYFIKGEVFGAGGTA